MKSNNQEEQLKEVKKENEQIKKYNVWKMVTKKRLLANVVLLTSTWAFKKKSAGDCRG